MFDTIEKRPLDHNLCLHVFAHAIADGVVVTARGCSPTYSLKAVEYAKVLSGLEFCHDRYIKRMFAETLPDPLEQQLEAIWSSFVTSMESIHTSWSMRYNAKAQIPSAESISQDCLAQAIRFGNEHTKKAREVVGNAVAETMENHNQATLLAELVRDYLDRLNLHDWPADEITWRADDARNGYGSWMNIVSVETITSDRASFKYACWNGPDNYAEGNIGNLFNHPRLRKDLQRLAKLTFERHVKFSEDFCSILTH